MSYLLYFNNTRRKQIVLKKNSVKEGGGSFKLNGTIPLKNMKSFGNGPLLVSKFQQHSYAGALLRKHYNSAIPLL